MSLAMTRQEREAFLADVHVGIISIPDQGRGPLTVPIWYAYDPAGELRVVTGRASRKGQLLARARPLAHRYLGARMGDRYVESTRSASEQGENVLVRMRPERWLTVDYAKASRRGDQ